MLSNIGRTAILLGEGSPPAVLPETTSPFRADRPSPPPLASIPQSHRRPPYYKQLAHHCGETWVCGVGWGSGIYIAAPPYRLAQPGPRRALHHHQLHRLGARDRIQPLSPRRAGVLQRRGNHGWIDPTAGRAKTWSASTAFTTSWATASLDSVAEVPADIHSPCFAWGMYSITSLIASCAATRSNGPGGISCTAVGTSASRTTSSPKPAINRSASATCSPKVFRPP